ncbi:MAG: 16S rRNA (guanine(527)-N(7))-methyltransferase RsmG [Bacillota bacterium]|nr:16S rRNA (guanine(527)-N(7))-methyltransferase RsmG [Bacillota bacterium]
MDLVKNGLSTWKIDVDDNELNSLSAFEKELLRVNEYMNLTAIVDHDEVQIKHFLDSFSLLTLGLIKENMKMIDIGCGAGFPSIPIKIILPSIEMTLLDSLAKRIDFLTNAARLLHLQSITGIHGRAEELSRTPAHREKYDIATARGVSNLSALCEYCLPFLKVGGYFLAMKGPDAEAEVENAKNAIGTLGGKLIETKKISLPFSDIIHSIVIIKKISQIQTKYPRKQAQIAKNPL